MTTTTSNTGFEKQPACFGLFYASGRGDCRCCIHSQDCMMAHRESKAKAVVSVPSQAIHHMVFASGTEGEYAMQLLSEWRERDELRKLAQQKFGGKGTGVLAALAKLVSARQVEIRVVGRKHQYRLFQ